MRQIIVSIFLALTMTSVHGWSIQQLTMMSVEKVQQKQGDVADTVYDKASIESSGANGATFIDSFDQRFDVDGPQLTETYDHDHPGQPSHHRGNSDGNGVETTLLPLSALRRLSPANFRNDKKHRSHGVADADVFSGDSEDDLERGGNDDEDEDDGDEGVFDDSPKGLRPSGGQLPSGKSKLSEEDLRENQDAAILNSFGVLQTDDDGMSLPLKPREIKRDWCFAEVFEQEIKHEGCLSVFMKNKMCYGQCRSFFVPRLEHENFDSCSYCTPTKARVETVTLACPGRANRVKKVDVIEECACRPCGHSYI